MQSFAYPHHIETRFYLGDTDAAVYKQMDADAADAQANGGTIVKRAKIGRNSTCPCGSGMKFKKCCINRAHQVR